jgi:hypothetical protein
MELGPAADSFESAAFVGTMFVDSSNADAQTAAKADDLMTQPPNMTNVAISS